MGKLGQILAGIWAVSTIAGADVPAPKPADFKIRIASYSVRPEPISTEDVVVRDGRCYVFPSNTKEVIVIEPARGRLELLDVGRKIQSELTFRSLDDSLDKIKATLRAAAEDREKQGGRANVLEARMTRDLFQTKLTIAHEPKSRRVRLTNPAVQVDADGEFEEDQPRLACISSILMVMSKLNAYRSPRDLPPFVELETIAALTGDRRMRPTEAAYLYRLAGPPQRFRRTYRWEPTLTERDVEAIARLDRLRELAPSVRYERYRPSR